MYRPISLHKFGIFSKVSNYLTIFENCGEGKCHSYPTHPNTALLDILQSPSHLPRYVYLLVVIMLNMTALFPFIDLLQHFFHVAIILLQTVFISKLSFWSPLSSGLQQ